MKLPTLFGKSCRGGEEAETGGDQLGQVKAAVAASGPWTTRNHVATKIFAALFVVGLVTGPVALFGQITSARGVATGVASPAPARMGSGDTVAADQQVLAEGAAVTLGWRWAQATGKEMATLAREVGLPAGRQVGGPRKAPGRVLAVTVLDAVAQQTDADATRWQVRIFIRGGVATARGRTYLVLVQVSGDRRAHPLTLPGQIPSAPAEEGAAVDVTTLQATHPLAKAATGWAGAMVAGKGDLDPWLSPGADMSAIAPAVCAKPAVSVAALAEDEPTLTPDDDQRVQATVTIICNADTKNASTLQYLLEFAGRDGRWEVSQLAPAPAGDPSMTATPIPNTPTPTPDAGDIGGADRVSDLVKGA